MRRACEGLAGSCGRFVAARFFSDFCFFFCVSVFSVFLSLFPCFVFFRSFHQSGRSIEKSSKSVDVPLCFNLAPYMTAPVASDSVQAFDPRAPLQSAVQVEDCWYHLYGIVSHGGGMGGGE